MKVGTRHQSRACFGLQSGESRGAGAQSPTLRLSWRLGAACPRLQVRPVRNDGRQDHVNDFFCRDLSRGRIHPHYLGTIVATAFRTESDICQVLSDPPGQSWQDTVPEVGLEANLPDVSALCGRRLLGCCSLWLIPACANSDIL